MQTLHQVVADLAKRMCNDYVILSLTNDGGSQRLNDLGDLFTEEQIAAMDDNCIIGQLREMPESIQTPEGICAALDLADVHLVTIHWTLVKHDGTIVEFDIDNSQVF